LESDQRLLQKDFELRIHLLIRIFDNDLKSVAWDALGSSGKYSIWMLQKVNFKLVASQNRSKADFLKLSFRFLFFQFSLNFSSGLPGTGLSVRQADFGCA